MIGGPCASDVMSLRCWHGVAEVGLLPPSDAAQCLSDYSGGCAADGGSLSEAGAMALWCCRRCSMWVRRSSVLCLLLIPYYSSFFPIPNLLLSLLSLPRLLPHPVVLLCISPSPPPHSPSFFFCFCFYLCCFPPLCYIWWLYLSARLDKLHRGCCCFSRQWPCQSWCQG